MTLATVALAIAAVAFSAFCTGEHRILYNPSESAPRGWYWLAHTPSYQAGMFVFAQLPASAAALADERRYLPRGIPVLKRISAAQGAAVCESEGVVRISGRLTARSLPRDSHGRPLEPWSGCRVLGAGEYFLLSRHSQASFDSRYFGPVNYSALLGRAIPIWTW